MKLSISLALALIAPASAFASVAEDITLIRGLLAPGTDVAQIQAAVIQGTDPVEAMDFGAKNYLIRDINGDRLADILVIVEQNPSLIDYESAEPKPCETYEPGRCWVEYKGRSLDLFLGQAGGGFALAFSNDKMVMGGDEGGVFGDPLEGFEERKSGAIALHVYGGSAWRWSFTDVMQFRNGDFYVIGQDSYHGFTGDLRSDTKSVNLITGRVVETSQKDGDAPVRTRRYKIAVKPLVRVADYISQANE